MPPEIIKKEGYDEKCDIWSAGIIVYYLLHGCQAFKGTNQIELYDNIVNTELEIIDSYWEDYSP